MTGATGKLAVLADYRDRVIHAIGEARAIGCVTDECRDLLSIGASDEINTSVTDVVEELACVLGTLQRSIDASDAGQCKHDEIHPYTPEGHERPVSGIYRCVACDDVLVEIKCRGCDIEMLPHQMAGHLAGRCWADDSPLITGAGT